MNILNVASVHGPITRRWRRFRALSRAERRLLLEVWVLLGGISVVLALTDYPRTRRALEGLMPRTVITRTPAAEDLDYAMRIGSLARIAGRHLPLNASCLRQSLLVWWLLRRRGLAPVLRIGVNKDQGFAAHAWVELDHRPVNDAADVAERFRALKGLET
jgi:hypothetical protein